MNKRSSEHKSLSIREFQDFIKKTYYERDKGRGLYATFTWLVEEVGELAEALLKGDKKCISEEIADVIAWTVSIANLVEIDVETAIRAKYDIK